MSSEKVRRTQELRRSSAATPVPSGKDYRRTPKHRAKAEQLELDLGGTHSAEGDEAEGEGTDPLPATVPSVLWQVSEDCTLPDGRRLSKGVEVKIKGERGRFSFVQHVRTDKGVEWIDVIGGPSHVREWRSFRPERVQTVHRLRTIISDEAQRRAMNAKRRARREELAHVQTHP